MGDVRSFVLPLVRPFPTMETAALAVLTVCRIWPQGAGIKRAGQMMKV